MSESLLCRFAFLLALAKRSGLAISFFVTFIASLHSCGFRQERKFGYELIIYSLEGLGRARHPANLGRLLKTAHRLFQSLRNGLLLFLD